MKNAVIQLFEVLELFYLGCTPFVAPTSNPHTRTHTISSFFHIEVPWVMFTPNGANESEHAVGISLPCLPFANSRGKGYLTLNTCLQSQLPRILCKLKDSVNALTKLYHMTLFLHFHFNLSCECEDWPQIGHLIAGD